MHAVSVGETRAIQALCKKFDDANLIISSMTETGHKEAIRSIPQAKAHIFLPFDIYWIIKPLIRKISPDLLIFSETDFWYQLIYLAKQSGCKIALVNGKMSQRSSIRFKKLNFFADKLFSLFDVLIVQTKAYQERFSLFVDIKNIHVTGNLKFDAPVCYLKNKKELQERFLITEKTPVLTIGSTHPQEEELLLNCIEKLISTIDQIKIFIVPRHPERFETMAKKIQERFSTVYQSSHLEEKIDKQQVILVDQMGVLRAFYEISWVAVVAGSYTKDVGGHNILEPACYGKPIVFGPYMDSQLELKKIVKEFSAGIEAKQEELYHTLHTLLTDSKKRDCLSQQALVVQQKIQGATDKSYQVLKKLL